MEQQFTHSKGKWSCKADTESTDTYFLTTDQGSAAFGETPYNAILMEKAPELLEAVINMQKRLAFMINLTPSGSERNDMCDENIAALELINSAQGKHLINL